MSALKSKSLLVKRILLFLSFSGSLLLLGGCWDRVEINDLAIVTAAAIDEKGANRVELSLQIFVPKSMGGQGQGQGGGGGGEKTVVISESGTNLADALSKLQMDFPRQIFWGQCKVFIFGEKLARTGIYEHLDFLLRHPQPRERGYMFVSKGKAKNVLELQTTLEPYSGEAVREMTNIGTVLKVTMQDLDEMLTGFSQAAALPYIRVATEKMEVKKPYKYTKFIGAAVFKKDRMVGDLSQKETRGLLWLKNAVKEYTVTARPRGERREVSFTPRSVHVSLYPQIRNKQWEMIVKVKTDGMLIQNQTKLDLYNPKDLKLVEQAYEADIKQRVEAATRKIQHDLKADINNFAEEFHRKYPRQWKQVENRWEEVFPTVKVHVQVDANIRRQGNINEPEKTREGVRNE